MKIIKLCLLSICLTYLVSCGQINNGGSLQSNVAKTFNGSNSLLAETPPPKIVKELNQQLEKYKPQIGIIFPKQEQILNQTSVDVQIEVKDFPIFKDEKLNLGNHLSLILDNEPAQQIYDVTNPVILDNLTPGTHSIRVFAARPWGESFKNDGAFAQTSFSVLTETNNNRPDRNLPLLTYNNPTGIYGAEPFLLDFYLTNAPLHSVAKNSSQLSDWQIKATVNGDSFILDNWQPVYLKGLNKGENWIQLELIDEAGNNIENAYNNTVRVITYNPQQQDTISKLVTDKISLADAQPIVEQNYYIQPVGEPEIIEPTIEEKEIPESITTEGETLKITEPVVEPTVDNRTQTETSTVESNNAMPTAGFTTANPISSIDKENNSNSNIVPDVPKITDSKTLEQPKVIAEPANQKPPEVDRASSKIPVKETEELSSAKSISPKQTTTIVKEDLPEPIAAIEIPEPETIEIIEDVTENKIAIATPAAESEPAAKTEAQSPSWWKKILAGLRQKLENFVELLPNQV